MRYFKTIAEFLLFSNIYLGICISALALPFTEGAIDYFPFHAFVFFATVSVYSLLRIRAIHYDTPEKLAYLEWAKRNTSIANSIKYIGIVLTILAYLFLSRKMQLCIVSLGIIWVLYNLPIFSGQRVKFGLRYVWFLKPFVVGMIIAGLVTLPLIDRAFDIARVLYAIFGMFCFASALVVLFEVKDMKVDRSFNTNTMPIKIGVAGTKLIGITLIFISLVATLLFYQYDSALLSAVKVTPFILMILYLTFFFDENTNEYTYWWLIDGWMLYVGVVWYFLI